VDINKVHLIDVDVCHGEELVKALKVALLNSAKDCRQNKIVLLKEDIVN